MKSSAELPEKSKRILNFAKKEFAQKGFHAASVDNIADNAGVGKGTVYRHFGSKESLFMEVSRETFTELLEHIETNIGERTFREAILDLLNAVVENHFNNRDIIRIIFHVVSKMLGNEKWRQRFLTYSNYEFNILKKIIKVGMSRGEISDEYNAENIAEILRDFASSIPKKILFYNQSKEKILKNNEILVDILINGMKRSPK